MVAPLTEVDVPLVMPRDYTYIIQLARRRGHLVGQVHQLLLEMVIVLQVG